MTGTGTRRRIRRQRAKPTSWAPRFQKGWRSAISPARSGGECHDSPPLSSQPDNSAWPQITRLEQAEVLPTRSAGFRNGNGQSIGQFRRERKRRFLRHGEAVLPAGRWADSGIAPHCRISLRPAIPRRVARQQSPLPLHRLKAILKPPENFCQSGSKTRLTRHPVSEMRQPAPACVELSRVQFREQMKKACSYFPADTFFMLSGIGAFHSPTDLRPNTEFQ